MSWIVEKEIVKEKGEELKIINLVREEQEIEHDELTIISDARNIFLEAVKLTNYNNHSIDNCISYRT